MKRTVLFVLLFLGTIGGYGHRKTGQVDLFCGAELNYADINYLRLYDVLINLTPGVKWDMGHGWMTAGQLSYGAVNYGYDGKYDYLRLGMAALSKEMAFGNNHHVKLTGGLFSRERYGLDARWMKPINSWLMIQARAGLTNRRWLAYDEQTFEGKDWTATGIVGANIWIDKWATEFRVSGGRYINKDYGVEGEVYCHFKHCSIGMFAQLHDSFYQPLTNEVYRNSGGFRVVMMLPPYKKSEKQLNIRPASNFRLTYNAQSDGYSMKTYNTDPEENEREYQMNVQWGTGLYR